MNPLDLIALARALVDGVIMRNAVSPTQTELRRAVSSAYYAMFHTLAASNANSRLEHRRLTASAGPGSKPTAPQIIAQVRNKLSRAGLGGRFPAAIDDFGEVFVAAQQARHSADYDPNSDFSATDVAGLISRVESMIATFNHTPEDIRRDLAVHILTNVRSD